MVLKQSRLEEVVLNENLITAASKAWSIEAREIVESKTAHHWSGKPHFRRKSGRWAFVCAFGRYGDRVTQSHPVNCRMPETLTGLFNPFVLCPAFRKFLSKQIDFSTGLYFASTQNVWWWHFCCQFDINSIFSSIFQTKVWLLYSSGVPEENPNKFLIQVLVLYKGSL